MHPISFNPAETVGNDDTTVLNCAGYYHNLILDSLVRLHRSLPDSTLASLFDDIPWLYQNLFVKGYELLVGLDEFQDVEIDTNGGYNFVVDLKDMLCDTTDDETSFVRFMQSYCQNDTLINFIKMLLGACDMKNYQPKLDSLLDLVETGNYSTYIKFVVRVGVSIAKSSMGYWTNYNGTGIVYKYKKRGDKILGAAVAIAAVDVISGVATAAISYVGGERRAGTLLAQGVIGAVAGSAVTFLGSSAGAQFLGKIGNWLKHWHW